MNIGTILTREKLMSSNQSINEINTENNETKKSDMIIKNKSPHRNEMQHKEFSI